MSFFLWMTYVVVAISSFYYCAGKLQRLDNSSYEYDIPLIGSWEHPMSSCSTGRFQVKRLVDIKRHNVIVALKAFTEFDIAPIRCTGIIVGHRYLMVPASCVTNKYRETLPVANVTAIHFIWFSTLVNYTMEISVKDIFVHDQYPLEALGKNDSPMTFDHNIALVTVYEDFTDRTTYICLAFLNSKSFYKFDLVFAINYKSLCGRSKAKDNNNNIYMTQYRAIDPCVTNFIHSHNIFCVPNRNLSGEYAPLCIEDNGTPLFIYEPVTERMILVGMVVHIDRRRRQVCATSTSNNIALRIYSYRNWIKEKLNPRLSLDTWFALNTCVI